MQELLFIRPRPVKTLEISIWDLAKKLDFDLPSQFGEPVNAARLAEFLAYLDEPLTLFSYDEDPDDPRLDGHNPHTEAILDRLRSDFHKGNLQLVILNTPKSTWLLSELKKTGINIIFSGDFRNPTEFKQAVQIQLKSFLNGKEPPFKNFKLHHHSRGLYNMMGDIMADDIDPSLLGYFRASMDDKLLIDKSTVIELTISREYIEKIAPLTATTPDGIPLHRSKAITIILRPIENLTVIGEDRRTIAIPEPKSPITLVFAVKGTALGPAEINFEIYQERVPLCILRLNPTIVDKIITPPAELSERAKAHGEVPFGTELHQLRIIEQRQGPESWYLYELDSPALDILETYESSRMGSGKMSKEEYIRNIYTGIETLWKDVCYNPIQFQIMLKNFGGNLADQLLPAGLQQRLWDNMEKIKSIQVISTEPFIPWELVLIKNPDDSGLSDKDKYLGELGLTRWLHGTRPPAQLHATRARYVIPDYHAPERQLPGAQAEKDILHDLFGAQETEPYDDKVTALLNRRGAFDLLHFACHGGAESGRINNSKLVLKERYVMGEYHPTYLTQLAVEQLGRGRLIDPNSRNRPMIVLNACQTGRIGFQLTGLGGFAKAFLDAGAGSFIGALWSVGDEPARIFIKTFYESLIAGNTLSQAATDARLAAKGRDATWISYAVYGHPLARLTNFE